MLFEKPVISIYLDGEEKFQEIFGDAAAKFTDNESLSHFLYDLSINQNFRDNWTENRLKIQKRNLSSQLYLNAKPAAQLVKNGLIQRLDTVNN